MLKADKEQSPETLIKGLYLLTRCELSDVKLEELEKCCNNVRDKACTIEALNTASEQCLLNAMDAIISLYALTLSP